MKIDNLQPLQLILVLSVFLTLGTMALGVLVGCGDAEDDDDDADVLDDDDDDVHESTWYADKDRDGYGDPLDAIAACDRPDGYVANNTDCDDTDDAVYPGSHAIEVPFDGKDTDCDGFDFCRDLNCDAYPDIIFSQIFDGEIEEKGYQAHSYVYFGTGGEYKETNRVELPTIGAMGAAAADLNGDGYLDIVFANGSDGHLGSRYLDSYIYWGSASGCDQGNRTGLPTVGAADAAVADANQDGYPDIVFSNRFDGNTYNINSYIYWGSGSGFDEFNRQELPTRGASQAAVADLNRDGYNDLVFASGSMMASGSDIYWGSEAGFSVSNVSALPVASAEGCAVADLNGDDYLDLVFSVWCITPGCESQSPIYWGSTSGYDPNSRTDLTTLGATSVRLVDLDLDGYKDIIFANGSLTAKESYIYWNSETGFDPADRLDLSTLVAAAGDGADLNGDGYMDIVLCSFFGAYGNDATSQIYWGSLDGYATGRRTDLFTWAASGVLIVPPAP